MPPVFKESKTGIERAFYNRYGYLDLLGISSPD